MTQVRSSNCTLDVDVDFYWHVTASSAEVDQIEQAVDALWDAIRRPGQRRWSPYASAHVRSEFRDRLVVAASGGLRPHDEVKPVGNEQAALFEIRWVDIDVIDLDERMEPVEYRTVGARLYHSEPLVLSVAAVGLHAHEKVIVDGDDRETHRLQDLEIAVAEVLYFQGIGSRWGIPRRG